MKRLVAVALLLAACGGPDFAADPAASVARLTGTVCGKPLVGTAIVIRDELMLTAAHNVTGAAGSMTITFADGESFETTVVGFDQHRDVAFLDAPGMHRLPIRMADPNVPASGTVIRILESSEPETVAYDSGELITAVGHDIYDDPSDVRRSTLRIEASIGSGFSGAPVLDTDGSLTAMVTLRSRSTGQIYAITTSEIRQAFAATDLETSAATGRCLP